MNHKNQTSVEEKTTNLLVYTGEKEMKIKRIILKMGEFYTKTGFETNQFFFQKLRWL